MTKLTAELSEALADFKSSESKYPLIKTKDIIGLFERLLPLIEQLEKEKEEIKSLLEIERAHKSNDKPF